MDWRGRNWREEKKEAQPPRLFTEIVLWGDQ